MPFFPAPDPGRMDRQITFEVNTPTPSATGQEVDAWAALASNATAWAEKVDLSGKEFFAARQINAEISAEFRIRYRSDVTRKMRINYGGALYDIHHIAEMGRREGLRILASAKVA